MWTGAHVTVVAARFRCGALAGFGRLRRFVHLSFSAGYQTTRYPDALARTGGKRTGLQYNLELAGNGAAVEFQHARFG